MSHEWILDPYKKLHSSLKEFWYLRHASLSRPWEAMVSFCKQRKKGRFVINEMGECYVCHHITRTTDNTDEENNNGYKSFCHHQMCFALSINTTKIHSNSTQDNSISDKPNQFDPFENKPQICRASYQLLNKLLNCLAPLRLVSC